MDPRNIKGPEDFLRLAILLQFDLEEHTGKAMVYWRPRVPLEDQELVQLKIAHAALHYGRILAIDGESRQELFRRVGEAARKLADGAVEAGFSPWTLNTFGEKDLMWPCELTVMPIDAPRVKALVSSLRIDKDGELWTLLHIPTLLNRMTAPASVLALVTSLAKELSPEQRVVLGKVLLAMNVGYGSVEKAASSWSARLTGKMPEQAAFRAAIPVLWA